MTTTERRPTIDSPVTPLFTSSAPSGEEHQRRGGRQHGIEIRVHGIGDHATYSALGRPTYKELVDSRVWIGQVPHLPDHPLRLVNWSRANRRLTHHLSWYLAFPFTLLNVAGYMEPKEALPRRLMRLGIALASLAMTFAMASWITVIVETAWRRPGVVDDRLTAVVVEAIGPGLLIAFICYRLVVGRALIDKGATSVAVASIVMLVLMVPYLGSEPASHRGGLLNWVCAALGHPDTTIDAMTDIVVGTSLVVWLVSVGLCATALRHKHNGAALAGAAILILVAITMLHAVGSILRLFTASVFRFHYVANGQAARKLADPTVGHYSAPKNALLPVQDSLGNKQVQSDVGAALRIDLIPAFVIAMVVLFALIVWLEIWRAGRRAAPSEQMTTERAGRIIKPASRKHEFVDSLPRRLAPLVSTAVLGAAALWIVLWILMTQVSSRTISTVLLALQVLGAAVVVLIVVRRPDELAEKLRRTFGSIADIAGFWAPDLHPLAGASYRRALLAGIRQAINDLTLEYPNDPIALVGHSQGSVVCAWFVRGGHWTERQTEATTDRTALAQRLHELGDRNASDRIALFTCGSPLFTLYQTFFPRYFDQQFFDSTRAMTLRGRRWRNYWRRTDPIGSPLPFRRSVDNLDVTESIDEETFGHSEYWRNERLRADIKRFFTTTEVRRRSATG